VLDQLLQVADGRLPDAARPVQFGQHRYGHGLVVARPLDPKLAACELDVVERERRGGLCDRAELDERELTVAVERAVEHGLAGLGRVDESGGDQSRVEELNHHLRGDAHVLRQVADVQPARLA
jgi:hypothetical protein